MANPQEFALTRRHLEPLPQFHETNTAQRGVTARLIATKKTDTKIKAVILIALAVIIGGCGAYLSATSGGPTNALLFYGGIGLSATAVGLLLVLAVVAEKARRFNNQREAELVDFLQQLAGNQAIYFAMTEREIDLQNLLNVLHHMSDEHYKEFVEYATGEYFGGRSLNAVTANETKLLAALAFERRFTSENRLILVDSQAKIINTLPHQAAIQIVERLSDLHYDRLVRSAMPEQTRKAVIKDDRFLTLLPELQRTVLEQLSQEDANGVVERLSSEQYASLATLVLTSEARNQVVLNALASSAYTSQLSSIQLRDLMAQVDQDKANAIVDILNVEKYKELYESVKDDTPQVVLNALASSACTSELTSLQQRKLMEEVDQEAAYMIPQNLEEEAFDQLATHVYESYFCEKRELHPKELVVVKALYNKANRLSPKQNFAFLNAFDQETANAATGLINLENYGWLFMYALEQPNNEKINMALAKHPEHAALLFQRVLTAEQQRVMMERFAPEFTHYPIGELSAQEFKALADQIYQTYFEGENRPQVNPLVIALLYPRADLFTPQQHLKFLGALEQDVADMAVERLSDEKFDQLATYVSQNLVYSNTVVVKALYQKGDRLNAEQNFAFIRTFDQERANATVGLMSIEQYHGFVVYASKQAENEMVRTAIAQRPEDYAALVNVTDKSMTVEEFMKTYALMSEAKRATFIKKLTQIKKINNSLAVVWKCIQATITVEFANSFAEEVSEDRRALLAQLANWPVQFAQHIVYQNNGLWKAGGMLNAIWEALDENGRGVFKNAAATTIQQQEITPHWAEIVKSYGDNGIPRLVLETWGETLRAVDYKQFRSFVVDNRQISSDPNMRYKLALDLLEYLGGKDAQKFVENIDKGFCVGHTRYTDMFKLLVQEAASVNSVDDLSLKRLELYLLFKRAPQHKSMERNGLNWTNFDKYTTGRDDSIQMETLDN